MKSEWSIASLSDLVDARGVTYGVVQPGLHDPEGVAILRVNNFREHGLELRDVMRIDPSIAAQFVRSTLKGGEVLITLVGTVGLVTIAPNEVAGWNVARAVGVIPVPDPIVAQWVARSLQAPGAKRYLDARLNTTVQKTLNLRDLASTQILLPPRDEMRRIIGVLAALDALAASQRALSDHLQRSCALLFREMFLNQAHARVPLSAIADHHRGAVQPGQTPEGIFEHFSIPAFDDAQSPSLETGSQMLSGKTPLPSGDCVLISKLNPATRRVWWPRPSGEGAPVCSPEFIVLRPKHKVPNSYVFASVREDERFQQDVRGRSSGTTGSRQRIVPSDLLTCTVPEGSSEELEMWASIADPLYRRALHCQAQIKHLVALRDVLLPRLISGRVRVPNSYDPSDVLDLLVEQVSTEERAAAA
jgi:type I restriction enzyme S subunit